jgi:hypothetical protein
LQVSALSNFSNKNYMRMAGDSIILSKLSRPDMEINTEASLSSKKNVHYVRGALGNRTQKDERRFVIPPACKKPL